MLAPKKVKYRKVQKGKMRGIASRGNEVSFGEYGLQAIDCGWVTARQIEATRVAIMRQIKRDAKLYIRVFPDKPITKKPLEVRMGKGKGNPEEWVAVVKPGKVLFEVEGVTSDVAKEAFRLASHKLALQVRMISRGETL